MSQERFGDTPDRYSEIAVDHFSSPRNVGALETPDGQGSDANPTCGDRTTITVRLEDGRVAEARFRTFGCVAAIASASMLTELVSGKDTAAARALGPGDVFAALGGLPERKEGCALLAVGALRAALVDAEVSSRLERGSGFAGPSESASDRAERGGEAEGRARKEVRA